MEDISKPVVPLYTSIVAQNANAPRTDPVLFKIENVRVLVIDVAAAQVLQRSPPVICAPTIRRSLEVHEVVGGGVTCGISVIVQVGQAGLTAQVVHGVGSVEVPVTAGPDGGVPEAIAEL